MSNQYMLKLFSTYAINSFCISNQIEDHIPVLCPITHALTQCIAEIYKAHDFYKTTIDIINNTQPKSFPDKLKNQFLKIAELIELLCETDFSFFENDSNEIIITYTTLKKDYQSIIDSFNKEHLLFQEKEITKKNILSPTIKESFLSQKLIPFTPLNNDDLSFLAKWLTSHVPNEIKPTNDHTIYSADTALIVLLQSLNIPPNKKDICDTLISLKDEPTYLRFAFIKIILSNIDYSKEEIEKLSSSREEDVFEKQNHSYRIKPSYLQDFIQTTAFELFMDKHNKLHPGSEDFIKKHNVHHEFIMKISSIKTDHPKKTATFFQNTPVTFQSILNKPRSITLKTTPTEKEMETLLKKIKEHNIKHLIISKNKKNKTELSLEVIVLLTDTLEKTTNIKSLSLAGYNLKKEELYLLLIDSLKYNSSLTSLNIENCSLGNNEDMLAQIVQLILKHPSLKEIWLAGNDFTELEKSTLRVTAMSKDIHLHFTPSLSTKVQPSVNPHAIKVHQLIDELMQIIYDEIYIEAPDTIERAARMLQKNIEEYKKIESSLIIEEKQHYLKTAHSLLQLISTLESQDQSIPAPKI